jgi:hypothetical protein
MQQSATKDWRDSYHVTCFLYGLRYATIEVRFLRSSCRGYITRVRLHLRRVEEGSEVEGTRTRMERVLSELWRLSTD